MTDDVKDALEEVRLCAKNESDPTTWALNHVLAHVDAQAALIRDASILLSGLRSDMTLKTHEQWAQLEAMHNALARGA